MLIQIKNKDKFIIDEFTFKCCIGKAGIKKKKVEGDKSTPKGTFSIGKLYYRQDRVRRPITNLDTKVIKPNMGWCNDPNHKNYNKEIKIKKKIKHEKLYRKDHKYNCLIVINYNTKKITPNNGSAIFIHLTKNFKPTAGCVAIKEKDFLILLKLINKKTQIKIY